MLTVSTVLGALKAVGPVVAALPDFRKLYDDVADLFDGEDQATLQEAYSDAIENNDAAHARLQEKLDAAARR